jgi:hypothetical protein
MITIRRSNLITALTYAIEAREKEEKKQGKKGDSIALASWKIAKESLIAGSHLQTINED